MPRPVAPPGLARLQRSPLWPTLPPIDRAEIAALLRLRPPTQKLAVEVRQIVDEALIFSGRQPGNKKYEALGRFTEPDWHKRFQAAAFIAIHELVRRTGLEPQP
jgi:hypothetical protein